MTPVPNPDPGQPDIGPGNAHHAVELPEVLEVHAVLGKFNDVHVGFACILLATQDKCRLSIFGSGGSR